MCLFMHLETPILIVGSLNVTLNPFITSKCGHHDCFREMVKRCTKLKCHLSPPVCVCVFSDWHVLTEHPYTCWVVVNRKEMWQSKIFPYCHHTWSYDFGSDLGKRKTGEAPTYVSTAMAGGGGGSSGGGAESWNTMSDVAGGKDWDTPSRGGGEIVCWKKKKSCDAQVTPHSQDLSPRQLSPPDSTCTNWNCLCVSISFISCLKVNVPLNEFMHSVWVPQHSVGL